MYWPGPGGGAGRRRLRAAGGARVRAASGRRWSVWRPSSGGTCSWWRRHFRRGAGACSWQHVRQPGGAGRGRRSLRAAPGQHAGLRRRPARRRRLRGVSAGRRRLRTECGRAGRRRCLRRRWRRLRRGAGTCSRWHVWPGPGK